MLTKVDPALVRFQRANEEVARAAWLRVSTGTALLENTDPLRAQIYAHLYCAAQLNVEAAKLHAKYALEDLCQGI